MLCVQSAAGHEPGAHGEGMRVTPALPFVLALRQVR